MCVRVPRNWCGMHYLNRNFPPTVHTQTHTHKHGGVRVRITFFVCLLATFCSVFCLCCVVCDMRAGTFQIRNRLGVSHMCGYRTCSYVHPHPVAQPTPTRSDAHTWEGKPMKKPIYNRYDQLMVSVLHTRSGAQLLNRDMRTHHTHTHANQDPQSYLNPSWVLRACVCVCVYEANTHTDLLHIYTLWHTLNNHPYTHHPPPTPPEVFRCVI